MCIEIETRAFLKGISKSVGLELRNGGGRAGIRCLEK